MLLELSSPTLSAFSCSSSLVLLGCGEVMPGCTLLWELWAASISNRAEVQLLADSQKSRIVTSITAWGHLNSESSWA